MAQHEDHFTPHKIDDQIEQTTQEQDSANTRLIETLRYIYQPAAPSQEDSSSLVRVKERILQRSNTPKLSRQEDNGEGLFIAQERNPLRQKRTPRSRFLRLVSVLAAVAIIGLTIGSWVVATRTMEKPRAEIKEPNVYIAYDEFIYKFDGQTGSVLWQQPIPGGKRGAVEVAVADGSVYVLNGSDISAFNAIDGKVRWHSLLKTTASSIMVAHDMVYLPSQEGLVALSAKDGSLKWSSSNKVDGRYFLPATDGILYAVEYSSLIGEQRVRSISALEGSTGKVHWRRDFSAGEVESYAFLAQGTRGIYLIERQRITAFDEQNGQELWTLPIDDWFFLTWGSIYAMPIVDGILYMHVIETSGTFDTGCEAAGFCRKSVRAFDLRTGKHIWSSDVGYVPLPQPAAQGQILALHFDNEEYSVHALDRSNGKSIWQIPNACPSAGCGQTRWTVANGNFYIITPGAPTVSPKPDLYRVQTFDLRTGKKLADNTISVIRTHNPMPIGNSSSSIPNSYREGIENGIYYGYWHSEHPSIIHLQALRLTDGKLLWEFRREAKNKSIPGYQIPVSKPFVAP